MEKLLINRAVLRRNTMNSNTRIVIAVLLIIWIIAPDIIPGPIDDVIALILTIMDIRGIAQAGNHAKH